MKKYIIYLLLIIFFIRCASNKPVKVTEMILFKGFAFKGGNSGGIYGKIRQMDINPQYLNLDTTDIFPLFKIPYTELENTLNNARKTKYHQFKSTENLYGGFFIDDKNVKHYILFSKVSMIDYYNKTEYWFEVGNLFKK
jgi:hypothetical protein